MSKGNKIPDTSSKNSKSEFRKCFEKLAYTESYASVFSDFVEFALLMMNINKKPEDFKELETRWPKPEQHQIFAEMFMHWTNSMEPFEDVLGDLFMECVSHGRNGQFFTPDCICEMMALMQLQGAELKPDLKILDCASGSGRMLLAAAKTYRGMEGFTPDLDMKYYAADNDALCAKMTALNFITNTMAGQVWHMDSLSLEHWKTYHIRKMRVGSHYIPYYYITGPGTGDWRTVKQIIETPEAEPVIMQQSSNITMPEPKISKHGQLSFF